MRRWLFRIALLIAIIGVALVIGIMAVGRRPPSWYQPPDPSDKDVARLAERVEYRLLEETQKIRPDREPWALRLREHQINSWLASRLPEWLAHEHRIDWPSQLGTPQVLLESHTVNLALPVTVANQERVIVAQLVPRIRDDVLALELQAVALGRLSVPGDPIESLLGLLENVGNPSDRPQWRRFIELLSGQRTIEPVLTLGDGRRVQAIDLRCRRGAIELTSLTLSAEQGAGTEATPRASGEGDVQPAPARSR